MSKQIKISEYMFRQLKLEKKNRGEKLKMKLSYSEVIGLLIGLSIQDIKKVHKISRYSKYFYKDR